MSIPTHVPHLAIPVTIRSVAVVVLVALTSCVSVAAQPDHPSAATSAPSSFPPMQTSSNPPPDAVPDVSTSYQGRVLPTAKPVRGLPVQPPSAWLIVEDSVVPATFAAGGTRASHLDPVPAMPDLMTVAIPAQTRATIVVDARSIARLQAVVRPWSEDGRIIPLFDDAARELQAAVHAGERTTIYSLEPIGDADDTLLRVHITLAGGETFYVWHLKLTD
jgi:hypothetical protein